MGERWLGGGGAARWLVCLMLGLIACGDDEAGKKNPYKVSEPDQAQDAGDDMSPPDMAEETPDLAPDLVEPARAVALEVSAAPQQVRAGESVMMGCQPVDQRGAPYLLEGMSDYLYQIVPEDALVRLDAGIYQAQRAGTVQVTCSSATLGLIDRTPVTVEVLAGAPHTVVTRLPARQIVAGGQVAVTCEVFDAFGNAVSGAAATVMTAPSGDGTTTDAQNNLTIIRAGIYDVSCQVDGAQETRGAELEVVPNLPAKLAVGRAPDQMVYGLGQVVTVQTIVTDIYDNVIPDATLAFVSDPVGESFGDGRVRYQAEGTYTVTATVQGPTHDGMPLDGSVQIVVNGTGPAITCVSPGDGAQVTAVPGGVIKFNGTVEDTNQVAELVVNGQPVPVAQNGAFSYNLTSRYGINFVDITARDAFGVENSRTCAFLVSERWTAENTFLDDAVSLRLAQSGVDDFNPNDGLDSLNDVLVTALNSAGLRNTLDAALRAQNPLLTQCLGVTAFGSCLGVTLRVNYENIELRGPNTTRLTLVTGGLGVRARVENVRVFARLDGLGSSGYAEVGHVEVDLTSDLKLINNQPRISLRQINYVTVGNVNLNFSGVAGLALELVQALFQGTIRNLVRDTIRDYVNQQFNALLDGIISGFDISTLGSSFNVPKLDGTGNVALGFGVRFSALTVTAARALFGVGTRFTAPINRPGATNGAPRLAGDVLLDPVTSQPIAATIYVGMLNQVLHALWRAGYFDVNLGGSVLSGLPMGSQVALNLGLPPVALLEGTRVVRLQLGTARLSLVYPGIFDDPLTLNLGATATSSVTLNGNDLVFGNVVIDELYFSPEGVSLDETNRDILEQFLRRLLQNVLNQSLNGALPALPIPSFELPASVGQFGLPVGAQLGVRQPGLSNTMTHFVLDGAFGVR